MFRYKECEPHGVLDNPALNTAYSPLFIVFSPFDYSPFLAYVTCLPCASSTCVYNGAHISSDASVLLTSAFHGDSPLGRLPMEHRHSAEPLGGRCKCARH